MKRIAITNGGGQFFDKDKAEKFEEEADWNGSNWISRATRNQFQHECLFRTCGGKWILNTSSDFAGSVDAYEIISDLEAVSWFLKQNSDLPEELQGKEKPYEIL